jgi:aspartate/methionine/tyrosine aminotransferase
VDRGIRLLVDESYSDFILDDSFWSMANFPGAIVVNSLSKNMGLSGWRIGYAIADAKFIEVLLRLNQHIITCAPTILLEYVAENFEDILTYTLPQARRVVEKRGRICHKLEAMGFRYMPGRATFYFFIDANQDTHKLAMDLLYRCGIAIVPGSAYGASTDKFFRMSVGTESEERIEKALGIMRPCMNY